MSLNHYRQSKTRLPSISTLQRVGRDLTSLHDALDRPLHIRPFGLSRYGSLADVVNVKMAIARTESDLFAVLSIPGKFVDRLVSADGDCGGWGLRTEVSRYTGILGHSITHLDVIVQVPQVEFTGAIHRPKNGGVSWVPFGVEHVVTRLFERTQWSNS